MNRIQRAWAALANTAKPLTRIATGGSQKQRYFSERTRNKEQLKKYETIYNQGGLVAEAIDCYAMFCLSNGWRLEGEDRPVQVVQDFLDTIDFDSIMWEGITDTCVYGDGFQENIFSRGQELVGLVSRLARTFEIIHDEFGQVSGYEQVTGDDYGQEYVVSLSPDQITHMQFFRLGGSVYGQSLIARAYDDIMRDTKVAESTAVAIERHGFRKYHIKVGLEGEDVPEEVLTDVDRKFRDLETKNEMSTTHDVDIIGLDEGGLAQVEAYSNISIERLASALGVPEELLGLRRGSTDATATKRIEVFFRKIATIQRKVARCYELNVFDRLVEPGSVKLVFNDVSPTDEAEKAKWISEIIKCTPLDPFIILPQSWIKEQFNIDPDAYEDEDEYIIEPEDDNADKEDQQDDKTGTDSDEDVAETV